MTWNLVLMLAVANIASGSEPVTARHGMVASSNGIASGVGVAVMREGGNAVDAACAVALALAVVHPAAGNLGGGGFMLIRTAKGQSVAIDYRETAPGAASRDMYLDPQGKFVPQRSTEGYLASGVPGTVAGLALAHRKFGKLPWSKVVQPAMSLAADGFVLSKALADSFRSTNLLAQFPETKRIFQRDGNFYKAGDLFRQPDLGQTLSRIAAQGPADFYRGKTAHLIASATKGHGLLSLKDLAEYRPLVRKPVQGTYRGYQVISMPPPSSGGIALLEMLNILESHNLSESGFDSFDTDHLLVEAMRRAFADRSEFLGDPDFVKIPVAGLTSKSYAREVSKTIDSQEASSSSRVRHGNPAGHESDQTTHFSVVDADGNAVSNTYTLNFAYGSGVTIPGAGFLMNNEMDDFTGKVGVPNGFGLIQGSSNSIVPRKRPLSSMSPTILVKDGKLFMVLGSPGGPTIITTVLQIISNVIDHGMSVEEAVGAARLHHQWLPDSVSVETGAIPAPIRQLMATHGYRLRPEGRWGDAEVIGIDPATGIRSGASDPRSPDAKAVGY